MHSLPTFSLFAQTFAQTRPHSLPSPLRSQGLRQLRGTRAVETQWLRWKEMDVLFTFAWINSFSPTKIVKNPLLHHNWFSTHFFSMKMAEFWKLVLVSSTIDFNDIQLWLRRFGLNLNICKVMTEIDSLPDFLRPKFGEDRHNFVDIEIQAKLSLAKLNIVEINNEAY